MAIGDIIETVITWENITRKDRYVNVLHWRCKTEISSPAMEIDAAEGLLTKTLNGVLPSMANTFTILNVLAQRVAPEPRTAGFVAIAPANSNGGQAGQALPPSTALVIRKRTIFAGRRFRGRVFVCGLVEADQDNGVYSGANYNSMAQQWDNIIVNTLVGPQNGAEFECVIWTKGTAAATATRITSTFPDDRVRSQRRREVGRGS